VRVIAFDTETNLIRPGRTAPPLTCMTWQEAVDIERGIFTEAKICLHTSTLIYMREWLADPDVVFVGHNIAFDFAVICAEFPELIPAVFAAYEADRITDTMLRQKLLDIAGGCYRGHFGDAGKWIKLDYSLQVCAKRLAGMPIKKEGFRMFYAFFRNVPLDRGVVWLTGGQDADFDDLCASFGDTDKFRTEVKGMVAANAEEAGSYPLDDARATMACFVSQQVHGECLEDQWRQARKAWCQHLTSAWGLRTNAAGVASLQMQTERVCNEIQKKLVAEGLVRPDGTRDTKLAKERMLAACGWAWDVGLGKYEPTRDDPRPLRLTDSGEPSLDSDACKAADDETMKLYAELTSLKTVLNKDIPALAKAVIYPIHTRFDMAETGRTTSSSPNVQNWRRLPGIRECFVPRPGRVFAQADYSSLELCTLAQACLDLLGHSALADMLNKGIDPHSLFASKILGWSYEETHRAAKDKSHPKHKEADNARQVGKVFNFGAPGGLGMKRKRDGSDATLIVFARKTYGIEITHEELAAYGETWHATFPEMREYFAHVNSLVGTDGVLTMTQLRSGRIRGGTNYTAGCNSYFQGLGADATGGAYFLIAKACYVDKASPLFGCRVVNYVHDEFIVEAPEASAAEAAEELSRLMVLGAQAWIPDVKLQAEPCLMRVWSKDAKTLRDTTGRLVAWAPDTKQEQQAKAA
jgi:DNA polymerase-1